MSRLTLTFEQLKELSNDKNVNYREADETGGEIKIEINNFTRSEEVSNLVAPVFDKLLTILTNLPKK